MKKIKIGEICVRERVGNDEEWTTFSGYENRKLNEEESGTCQPEGRYVVKLYCSFEGYVRKSKRDLKAEEYDSLPS